MLHLPVNIRNLQLQRRALQQLSNAPLPHHQGLLRLCEDPRHTRWPAVGAAQPTEWRALTDETRSGTPQQRQFVSKALGTPDFAFLEGPPGSGKTTAICEIVQQLVEDGQRVLLCASTNVAIDNVLERLLETDSPIDAVRIGRPKRDDDDDTVQRARLDQKVAALVDRWRNAPSMTKYGYDELHRMAERVVVMGANLTCGTTMGIVNHPLFRGRDEDLQRWQRPISTLAHWDVLIIDEASKTLIQEFLVPALMARRWVIVGDVRQLPPFADRADIVANLRDLVDENDRSVFPRDHQRACLLLFRLLHRKLRQPGMRWLIVEPPGVLTWIERELAAKPPNEALEVVQVVAGDHQRSGAVRLVTIEELKRGDPVALLVAAADWVLVAEGLQDRVSHLLPPNLIPAGRFLEDRADALACRNAFWMQHADRLPQPYRERRSRKDDIATVRDCQQFEAEWLARHDLGQELAWRITRLHELRRSRSERYRSGSARLTL